MRASSIKHDTPTASGPACPQKRLKFLLSLVTGHGVVSSFPRYHPLGAVSSAFLISVTNHKVKGQNRFASYRSLDWTSLETPSVPTSWFPSDTIALRTEMASPRLLQLLLSPSIVLASFIVLLLSYIFVSSTINYRKLSQFKGPPLAAFSRFWLFWEECSARLPKSQAAAIRQYGNDSLLQSIAHQCDMSQNDRECMLTTTLVGIRLSGSHRTESARNG